MAITRRKLFNYLITSSIATLISSKKAFSSNEPDLVNSLKNQSSNMKIEESFKKIDSRLDDIEKEFLKVNLIIQVSLIYLLIIPDCKKQ